MGVRQGARYARMPSTVIEDYDYDSEAGTLNVTFTTGRRYTYFDVPPDVAHGLDSASSRGAYFNRCIRPHYEYREVVSQ